MTKKLQTNVSGYIDWIYQSNNIAERVFLASERGVDRMKRMMLKIFYDSKSIKQGKPAEHTFNGWTHFIAVLKDHGDTDVSINMDKTKSYIKKHYPDFYKDAKMSVDYIPLEDGVDTDALRKDLKDTVDSFDEDSTSLSDVKQLPDVELIKKVCEEETAKEFKKWLKEYLDTFPTFGYTVPSNKGKQRICDEIEKLLEEK